MNWFKNIYIFIHSFFEILSYRTKPKYDKLDENNYDEYESIILNENIK